MSNENHGDRRTIALATCCFLCLSIVSIFLFYKEMQTRDKERMFLAMEFGPEIREVRRTAYGHSIFLTLHPFDPYEDHAAITEGSLTVHCVVDDKPAVVEAMREVLDAHTKYDWTDLSWSDRVDDDGEKSWESSVLRYSNSLYIFNVHFVPWSRKIPEYEDDYLDGLDELRNTILSTSEAEHDTD